MRFMYKKIFSKKTVFLFNHLYFLLGVFLFCATNTYANKQVYIAISSNDCLHCSTSMYAIIKIIRPEKVNIVFPKYLEQDSVLVVEKYGLYNDKEYNLIFSDSIFEQNVYENYSTICIRDGLIVCLKQKLKSLNKDEVIDVIKCQSDFPSPKNHFQRVHSIIFEDTTYINHSLDFNKYTYSNAGEETSFFADSAWLARDYQIFYGEQSFLSNLNQSLDILKTMTTLKNNIKSVIKKNDSILSFLESVPFFEYSIQNFDTTVTTKYRYFIHEYNTMKKSFSNHYYINEYGLEDLDYYIKDEAFSFFENNYIFLVNANKVTANSKFLAQFKIDKNQLKFEKFVDASLPNNYIKYELKNNLQNVIFHENLVAYRSGSSIYDLKKHIDYNIPLSEAEFKSPKDFVDNFFKGKNIQPFFIYDLKDSGGFIKMLYVDTKNKVALLTFEKKNPSNNEIVVISNDNSISKITHISFFKNYIVYKTKDGDKFFKMFL